MDDDDVDDGDDDVPKCRPLAPGARGYPCTAPTLLGLVIVFRYPPLCTEALSK